MEIFSKFLSYTPKISKIWLKVVCDGSQNKSEKVAINLETV